MFLYVYTYIYIYIFCTYYVGVDKTVKKTRSRDQNIYSFIVFIFELIIIIM